MVADLPHDGQRASTVSLEMSDRPPRSLRLQICEGADGASSPARQVLLGTIGGSGAASGIRTLDLLFTKQLLYH